MPAPPGNQYAVGNSGGRPSVYTEKHAILAGKLCLLGATDAEIADALEISESTLNAWKHDHEEFSESLKKGKMLADAEIASKLYHRASGYSHDAVKIFQYEGQPVIVPYTEVFPPDTTAAIFWLKNRRPDLWRDRQEITGPNGGPQQHEMIDRPPAETREEWIARRQRDLEVTRNAMGTSTGSSS